ncbi:MAG: type I-E CRISPR-associated protein Cas6/Cse3/CasE [Armatimonadetes bacterium]|nr:type I-E CRISPR-associated protein Cas6/Cse3/CasE [Armatimonadota bacterium]
MNTPLYISAIRFPAASNAATTAWRDFYMLHKLVYSAFATKEDATAARPLFRFDLEGEYGYLYVQSTQEPNWARIPEPIRAHLIGPLQYEIPAADRLRFRLLARPSWHVPRGRAVNGKQKRYALKTEKEQMEWLLRKGEEHGFSVESCILTERVWHDTKENEQHKGGPKPLIGIQYDGILAVTDREKLHQAIQTGIGPQKAYGFGLLSVAPL